MIRLSEVFASSRHPLANEDAEYRFASGVFCRRSATERYPARVRCGYSKDCAGSGSVLLASPSPMNTRKCCRRRNRVPRATCNIAGAA